jgi:DHA1 family bicyclomycin/chloramphenicol resistance-like MFS transporter
MSSSPPSHRAAGRLLVALLGALAMLGPFSNDSVLPSFPFIGATFSVTDVQVQQILTVYFVPFAFMMLLHGTLSDTFGRRRIILTGVAVYSLAALVCAFASSFEMFLAGRVLQGLSAGAGVVVGRAIIRDVQRDADAQRAMALLMTIFGVAPAIAPIIGGWLGHLFGWRAVFLFLSLLAACLLAASTRWLPETLPPAQRVAFSLREIGIGFSEALTNARFVMLMLAFGFNFAGFFIYIVASPAFGYRILGIEQTEFVWIFGPGIIGWVCSTFSTTRTISPRCPFPSCRFFSIASAWEWRYPRSC